MAKHAGIVALLAAAIPQLAVADHFIWETEWEDVSLVEPDIHVQWGVDWDSSFVATTNRTLLCHTPESPSSPTNFWTLSEFQATSLEFKLLGIGDGSWEDGKGWLSPRWLPVNAQLKIWRAGQTVSFGISASDIPLATFGDWNVADDGSPAAKAAFVATRKATSPVTETEIRAAKLSEARAWYEQRWRSQHAVCLLVDTNQVGMAHVFSPEPWKEGSIAVSNTVMLGTGTMAIDRLLFPAEPFDPSSVLFYNNAPELLVKAERKPGAISGCAFIGEQVPPWCIWLADCGLTDAELSQWPDKIVQFAFEQHIRPDDPNILKRFQSTLFLMR